MSRQRSPNHPSTSLKEAIDRASAIFSAERNNHIDRGTAAVLLGYSGPNGASDKMLGTLVQFGLLERAGKGEVRVPPAAVDILHPETEASYAQALWGAASKPVVFAQLLERYPPGDQFVPDAVASFLVRQGYQDTAIPALIKSYTATAELLAQQSPRVEEGDQEPEPTLPPIPPDEQLLERVSAEKASPVHQSKLAPSAQESEWMRIRTGRTSEVRILVSGTMNAAGVGRLIRMLEAQKEILEEDDIDLDIEV
jgi:hypothetical protein